MDFYTIRYPFQTSVTADFVSLVVKKEGGRALFEDYTLSKGHLIYVSLPTRSSSERISERLGRYLFSIQKL
jgi:hypothetical protein